MSQIYPIQEQDQQNVVSQFFSPRNEKEILITQQEVQKDQFDQQKTQQDLLVKSEQFQQQLGKVLGSSQNYKKSFQNLKDEDTGGVLQGSKRISNFQKGRRISSHQVGKEKRKFQDLGGSTALGDQKKLLVLNKADLVEILRRKMSFKKKQENLYLKSENYRWKRICQEQMRFFQDKSVNEDIFHFQDQNKARQLSFIQQSYQRLVKFCFACLKKIHKLPLILPQHKMVWDVFHFFIILMGFELIPLHISFPEFVVLNDQYLWWAAIFYFFDILIHLNTSFYLNGKYVDRREDILKLYIQERLFTDVVSLGPLYYHLTKDNEPSKHNLFFNDIPLVLFYLKFSQFKKLKNKIQEMFSTSNKFSYIYDLFQLIIIVLTFSHLSACCFVYLARYERSQDSNSWIDSFNFGEEIGMREYMYGFYFSTITMSSVGYGDISPVNQFEVLICIFFVFIASFAFAFTINSLGEIIKGLAQDDKEKEELIIQANKYLKSKGISIDLQFNIREYIEYYYRENLNKQSQTENKIFQIISSSLKQKLLMEKYKIALRDSPIFAQNFSEQIIDKMVNIIHEVHFNPDQNIRERGDQMEQLYFVIKGEIDIYIEKKFQKENFNDLEKQNQVQKVIHKLHKNDSFGEVEFFSGNQTEFSYRSKSFSTCLVIQKSDFLTLLQTSPQDYEKYCLIKDKLIFQQNQRLISTSCFSCKNDHHFLIDCPYLTYRVPMYKIFNQQNKGINSRREDYRRKRPNKFQTLIQNDYVFQKILEIQDDYQENLPQMLYNWLKTTHSPEFIMENYFAEEEETEVEDNESIIDGKQQNHLFEKKETYFQGVLGFDGQQDRNILNKIDELNSNRQIKDESERSSSISSSKNSDSESEKSCDSKQQNNKVYKKSLSQQLQNQNATDLSSPKPVFVQKSPNFFNQNIKMQQSSRSQENVGNQMLNSQSSLNQMIFFQDDQSVQSEIEILQINKNNFKNKNSPENNFAFKFETFDTNSNASNPKLNKSPVFPLLITQECKDKENFDVKAQQDQQLLQVPKSPILVQLQNEDQNQKKQLPLKKQFFSRQKPRQSTTIVQNTQNQTIIVKNENLFKKKSPVQQAIPSVQTNTINNLQKRRQSKIILPNMGLLTNNLINQAVNQKAMNGNILKEENQKNLLATTNQENQPTINNINFSQNINQNQKFFQDYNEIKDQFIIDMDFLKNYFFYYPEQNHNKVIENYNRIMKNKRVVTKKSSRRILP